MQEIKKFYTRCVKINDHPYLIGWFVIYKTMMPTADIDFSNFSSRFSHIVVFPT